jgi:hypothetical protein
LVDEAMLPNFIFPETTIHEDGTGPAIELGDAPASLLLLTLGILEIVEQESLDLSVWASANGEEWGEKPVRTFPQKFYRGTYQILLDLSARPDAKYLRVQWKVHRWGVGLTQPLFRFYVFAEPFAAEGLRARTA